MFMENVLLFHRTNFSWAQKMLQQPVQYHQGEIAQERTPWDSQISWEFFSVQKFKKKMDRFGEFSRRAINAGWSDAPCLPFQVVPPHPRRADRRVPPRPGPGVVSFLLDFVSRATGDTAVHPLRLLGLYLPRPAPLGCPFSRPIRPQPPCFSPCGFFCNCAAVFLP